MADPCRVAVRSESRYERAVEFRLDEALHFSRVMCLHQLLRPGLVFVDASHRDDVWAYRFRRNARRSMVLEKPQAVTPLQTRVRKDAVLLKGP